MIQKKSSVTAELISPIFREIILQLHSIKPLLVSHSQIYLHSSVSELENGVTAPIIFLLQGGKKGFSVARRTKLALLHDPNLHPDLQI